MTKPKTVTIESFIAELRSSLVGKLFEDKNGEPDTILLMQKYIDEGRGSSLEQILMGRAIAELNNLRHWKHHWMGVKEETKHPLSIKNVIKICHEDEQNQLAEMLRLQEEANENNQEFNKGNMK